MILKSAALFALCLALFSCKRNAEVELEEYTPLSKAASDLSAGAQWSYEIESGRLDKKIDSFESIGKSVPLLPLSIVALEAGSPMTPVYPELEGFGSLDTSNIQGELFDTIKAFCLGILEYSKSFDEYEKYQAAAAKKSESEKKDEGEKAEESVPSNDSSKIDAFFSKNSLFSLALFLADSREAGVLKSFVIGRPVVGEELMEVPVLWTGEKEILRSKLFPVQEGGNWKIQQIEIYSSEEKNGISKTDRN